VAHRSLVGSWTSTEVATGDGADQALAIDVSGGLHLVFPEGSPNNRTRVAYRPAAGSWTASTLLLPATRAVNAATDTSGQLHVLYVGHSGGQVLRHMAPGCP